MVANAASAILNRVIDPLSPDLSPDAARAFLRIGFRESDRAQMAELATKARQGVLSAQEKEDLDGFIEVGLLIDLLQSKARLSLQTHGDKA